MRLSCATLLLSGGWMLPGWRKRQVTQTRKMASAMLDKQIQEVRQRHRLNNEQLATSCRDPGQKPAS